MVPKYVSHFPFLQSFHLFTDQCLAGPCCLDTLKLAMHSSLVSSMSSTFSLLNQVEWNEQRENGAFAGPSKSYLRVTAGPPYSFHHSGFVLIWICVTVSCHLSTHCKTVRDAVYLNCTLNLNRCCYWCYVFPDLFFVGSFSEHRWFLKFIADVTVSYWNLNNVRMDGARGNTKELRN